MLLSFLLLRLFIWCMKEYTGFAVHSEALMLSSRW